MGMKSLPMLRFNLNPFDRINDKCNCRYKSMGYETGKYIRCKFCDGIINRVNRLSSGNHVVDGECLGTNLNEDIKSKIKLSDYCDCPFCSDVINRKELRDIDEYI